MPDLAWMERAACRGMDPALFYPEGHDAPPILNVCAACPVKPECYAWALHTRQKEGVWGGVLFRPRKRASSTLRRRSEADVIAGPLVTYVR